MNIVNARRVSPFLKVPKPAASKIIYGAKRNVIADSDTFRHVFGLHSSARPLYGTPEFNSGLTTRQ
jgi:hypothetical protein